MKKHEKALKIAWKSFYKHLERNETCSRLCSTKCFQVLDFAATELALKIKEAIHIKREHPSLNSQVKHVNLKLYL